MKISNLGLGRMITAFSFHDLEFGVGYVLQWQKEKESSPPCDKGRFVEGQERLLFTGELHFRQG